MCTSNQPSTSTEPTTAAHHAALRGLTVACVDEGGHMGGLVMNVSAIDGYPAMGTVGGAELAAGQLEAILDLGVEIIPDTASALRVDGDVKTVTTGMGDQKAKTVIVASGARLKSLGVPGEEALFGRGVSQCADCDGGFFVDQKVAIYFTFIKACWSKRECFHQRNVLFIDIYV